MRKLFSIQFMLLLAMLLSVPLIFMACSDDEEKDPPPPPPKTDGFYVFGTNTVAKLATDLEARMALAVLDPSKAPAIASKPGVYGKYMYIGANSTIQFMEVLNQVPTTFGATNGGTTTLGVDIGNIPINDMVIHGELLADGPAIKVTTEGLYYTFVDTNDGIFAIVPVKANIIGDATPLEWGGGTALPIKSSSVVETVFEGTSIGLKHGHGYRYRINDGWHAYESASVITLSSMGVAEGWEAAWAKEQNDIGFFLENAPHNKEDGVYTIQLKYTASSGVWTETKTKTGILQVDYTDVEIGFLGNAFYIGEDEPGDWVVPYDVKTPVKEGSVYTWTWNDVELIEGNEFVILKDGGWGGGMSFLWNAGVVRSGSAFSENKITNTGDNENFHISVGGTYDIVLTIDASTGIKTLTIE